VRRRVAHLLASFICSLLLPCATSAARQNIWASDLRAAQSAFDRAQDRLHSAEADLGRINAALPRAAAAESHWQAARKRSRAAATPVVERADALESDARLARNGAKHKVDGAKEAHRAALDTWRTQRGWRVALAAILVALVASALGALAIARSRPGAQDPSRRVEGPAAGLGAGVAAYLCALFLGLDAFDAFMPSLPVVLAAATGVTVGVAAVIAAWRRGGALLRARAAAGPLALAAPALALALAALLVIDATGNARPVPSAVPAETIALAQAAELNAAMPEPVQRVRARADRLEMAHRRAASRWRAAVDRKVRLASASRKASARRRNAERAIRVTSADLASVQAEFDGYQRIIDRLDDYSYPHTYTGAGSGSIPDYSGDSPYPTGAPTTEDFGSGSGHIGLCSDGTLSDSVGRQGACSHHGGVAGG